eukprot:364323-Chlamydomonas_euryale.AAC.2
MQLGSGLASLRHVCCKPACASHRGCARQGATCKWLGNCGEPPEMRMPGNHLKMAGALWRTTRDVHAREPPAHGWGTGVNHQRCACQGATCKWLGHCGEPQRQQSSSRVQLAR